MQSSDQLSVGVVIRTRDRPGFVTRALASVAAQTHRNWTVALVNDGGDPARLAQAIAPWRAQMDPAGQLRVIDLDPGQGRAAAFNCGVGALETDFIACLDDDDTWDPAFLSALLDFWSQHAPQVPELAAVAAKVTALREDIRDTEDGPEIIVLGEESLPPAFQRGEFFLNALAYACYRQDIYPVQWIIRRAAVREIGGFPEVFDVMEDRAFLNRFLARYRLAFLDRKLAFHHRRVTRQSDTARDVLLNTLDNPSYDWRFFADLARPDFDRDSQQAVAAPLRSVAADLLAELNYETSALWQKLDAEMRALRDLRHQDRSEHDAQHNDLLDCLKSLREEMRTLAMSRPDLAHQNPARSLAPATGPVVFDLWQTPQGADIATYLTPGARIAGRLSLSRDSDEPGVLLNLSGHARRLDLQVPDTGGWTALELWLDGLAPGPGGLRAQIVLQAPQVGYLFETAFFGTGPAGHEGQDFEVHFCRDGVGCVLTRQIGRDWLMQQRDPKLSIILPRAARNFRLTCTALRIEQIAAV